MKLFGSVALLLALALAGGATADDAENRPARLLRRSVARTHLAAQVPAEAAPEAAPEASFVEVKAEGGTRLQTVLAQLKRTSVLYLAQQAYQSYAARQPTTGGAAAAETGLDKAVHWLVVVISMFFWVIVVAIIAYFYEKHKEAPVKDPSVELDVESFKEFKHGLFMCFEQPETCLWACMCPAIRWARTASWMGLTSFWVGFGLFVLTDFFAGITGEVMLYALLAIGLCVMRQKMRAAFDMKRQGGVSYAEDCCLYCWCMFCTVTQEARQVEDAMKAGHPAVPPQEKKEVEA